MNIASSLSKQLLIAVVWICCHGLYRTNQMAIFVLYSVLHILCYIQFFLRGREIDEQTIENHYSDQFLARIMQKNSGIFCILDFLMKYHICPFTSFAILCLDGFTTHILSQISRWTHTLKVFHFFGCFVFLCWLSCFMGHKHFPINIVDICLSCDWKKWSLTYMQDVVQVLDWRARSLISLRDLLETASWADTAEAQA